jgi:hypothetical protein
VGPSFGSCIVKEIGQLSAEAHFAVQQQVMREKKIDGGAQVRLGRRPLTPPAEAHGLDRLRLVVPILHRSRGPVREFEPTPSVLIPSARPQYAVKRLATGIQPGL